MEFLQRMYESLQGVFNLAVLSSFILIGLFLIIVDKPILTKKKLHREGKLAKALGYIYIVGGIAIYAVFTLLD